MKYSIAKAILVCTIALSILFVGVASTDSMNSYNAVCHDGPLHEEYVF